MNDHTSLNKFKYKWALITGGCSGIGRAYAKKLASQGINVLLVSDNQKRLAEAKAEILNQNCAKVEVLNLDLSTFSWHETIRNQFELLDIRVLICNASIGMGGSFWKQDLVDVQKMIGLNVNSYVALAHIFINQCINKQGPCSLVLVSSVNATSPVPMAAAYTATKAFEFYLGGALWQELQDSNIDLQLVMPGATRTDFQRVAGTQIPRTAVDPDELVRGAVASMGKGLVFVPKLRNKFIFYAAKVLPFEKRIKVAANYYRKLLNEKPDIGMFRLFLESFFKTEKGSGNE